MTTSTGEVCLFDVEEVAKCLKITTRSVHKLINLGTIKPIRLPNIRRILFDPQDLVVLIEQAKKVHRDAIADKAAMESEEKA